MLRLIDANANRACEGLRILEDLARFVLNDSSLSRRAKELRHAVRGAIHEAAVFRRDTDGDVGIGLEATGTLTRRTITDTVRANAARAAEALRTLEEIAAPSAAVAMEAIAKVRYQVYDLEKRILSQLPAARFKTERLYVLIDPGMTDDPVATALAAIRGGAGVIQLRAKNLTIRVYRDLAQRLLDGIRPTGALFIVNDHVAIAAAIGADGVHLGQDDLAVLDARLVLPGRLAIGLSTHTPQQVADALKLPVDYLGLGPMFSTTTKPHEPVRGPDLLKTIPQTLTIPSYAIGGITLENLPSLLPMLPHGIAVTAVVNKAHDPESICRKLCEYLESKKPITKE